MILLSELQYFSPVILFKKVIDLSHVVFDIYEDHRKMSFRNRCVIAGSGGTVNLSIPLSDGRNQRRPMKEVRIDNKTAWQGQHWKTITSCYNRSPWFEFYKHELELVFQKRTDWLVDWNRICWDWVVGKLGLEIQTSYREVPRTGVEAGGKFVAEMGVEPGQKKSVEVAGFEPGSQQTTAAANYIDWRNKLMPKSINTDFPEPIRYRQVFEDRNGFIPHLSILDLLFCEGKRTVEILESSKIPI
jgi:hypothetical protein